MILFGASGHCKVILDILRENKITVSAIYDDHPKYDSIDGVPVVQTKHDLLNENNAIITVGNNLIRKLLTERFSGFAFQKAIHPSAVISATSKVEYGTVIMAGSVINASAVIGRHCIINTGAVIEHDCILRDFVHISPNAALAGNVEVGEGTHIGIGASVIQGIKIGEWCTIGAGAVIISDIPDNATVVGNPGRIIKVKN